MLGDHYMQNPIAPLPAEMKPLVRMAVRTALKGAMISGAVAATVGAGTAQAQQPAATTVPSDETQLQEVVVTGSRIKQPALEAVSPVTTVSAVELQQTGYTRVEDMLNTLPQVTADQGGALANGATGVANIGLRGLGPQRTLVLIDGRRLMPGDPTSGGNAAPDLNQVPGALVERIDVLTGGASAVYGADAVAGVVNFVMNDHFEGVRLDANASMYNHKNSDADAADPALAAAGFNIPTGSVNDGQNKDFTVLLGSNFDDGKGNATVYMGYRTTQGVLQATRDYSACSLTSSGPARVCGGSHTTNPAAFITSAGYVSPGPGGVLVPTSSLPAGGLYNYAPLNYFQRPDERYTGGVFAHLDLNEHARVYTEIQFMDDRTRAQIAPSGAFVGAGTATTGGVPDGTWLVNCSNPFLSASELTTFCGGSTAGNVHLTFGRRDVEGGNRIDDLGHTSFRTVLGVKGDINDAWSYDTYFQNGITRFSEEYFNDVSKSAMANALQVTTNAAGQAVCISGPPCVPWNIFTPGGVTPAAVNYISVPGEQKGNTQEMVWEGSITGDLGKMGVKLPTAQSGLGLSVGADWRQESTELQPDEEFITNDLAGQGSPTLPTTGEFHVWEIYGEARLPILEDQPFAKSLTAELGYRYSDYDLSFGSTNTWKAGLQWAPVSDVHLRAMYNVAVRAPNLQELYLQPRVQLDGTEDPCAGATPAATAAQCAASGVTAAEYGHITPNSSSQYNGLIGGNTSLKPETADTLTLGLVFTPTFLPELNMTLDYYDIKIKNVISSYGANLILNDCVATADPFYCNLVHRAPATGNASDGSLWIGTAGYITDTNYNLGEQTVKGIDYDAEYRLDMGRAGRLDFNLAATYTLHFKTTPVVGGGTYDCAGYYGPACAANAGDGPVPHIKSKFRINWNTPLPGLDTWINWRLVGPVKVQNLSQNPLLSGFVDPINGIGNQIPGFNYIDLGASYQVAKQLTVRVGVNNLLDKDPPIVQTFYEGPPYQNGNTFPQVYDWGGRYLFVNLTMDF
jgi:outer membrane receptor protein involved in Fe transport